MSGQKPPRTMGVSLAILASVMLFTVLPLLQVILITAIQSRFASVDLSAVTGADPSSAPIASGGEIGSATDAVLVFQVVLGLAYLLIAMLAWRGRPPVIRQVMVGVVLLLMVITIGVGLLNIEAPKQIQNGIDSGRDLERGLLISRTVLSGLVALYVVWYMNRGPARAFYRGYYLPEPKETAAH